MLRSAIVGVVAVGWHHFVSASESCTLRDGADPAMKAFCDGAYPDCALNFAAYCDPPAGKNPWYEGGYKCQPIKGKEEFAAYCLSGACPGDYCEDVTPPEPAPDTTKAPSPSTTEKAEKTTTKESDDPTTKKSDSTTSNTDDSKPVVFLYYEQWAGWGRRFCPTELFKDGAFKGVTHVHYSFQAPDPEECDVITIDPESDYGGDQYMTACEKECFGDGAFAWDEPQGPHRGNVGCFKKLKGDTKVGISLGGWTLSDGFSPCVHDEKKRAKFIKSVVDAVEKDGWDYVDIDWEYPGGGGYHGFDVGQPDDWDLYKTLITELKDELSVPLYGAFGMNSDLIEGKGHYDDHPTPFEFLCDKLDMVGLMTYDLFGPWDDRTGFLAPLHSDDENPNPSHPDQAEKWNVDWVVDYVTEKCGKDNLHKLLIGMASYGKSWEHVDHSTDNGLYQKVESLPDDEKSTDYSGEGTYREVVDKTTDDTRRKSGTLSYFDIKLNYENDERCEHFFHEKGNMDFLSCPHEMFYSPDLWVCYAGPENWYNLAKKAKDSKFGGYLVWASADSQHTLLATELEEDLAESDGVGPAKQKTTPTGYQMGLHFDAALAGWNGESLEAKFKSTGKRVGLVEDRTRGASTAAHTRIVSTGLRKGKTNKVGGAKTAKHTRIVSVELRRGL